MDVNSFGDKLYWVNTYCFHRHCYVFMSFVIYCSMDVNSYCDKLYRVDTYCFCWHCHILFMCLGVGWMLIHVTTNCIGPIHIVFVGIVIYYLCIRNIYEIVLYLNVSRPLFLQLQKYIVSQPCPIINARVVITLTLHLKSPPSNQIRIRLQLLQANQHSLPGVLYNQL